MKTREAGVVKSFQNLHWAGGPFDNIIKTTHGDIVGEIVAL